MIKIPTKIDSSILAEFRRCPRSFYYRYVLCLEPSHALSVDLSFGGAFALAVETMRKAVMEGEQDGDTVIAQGVLAAVKEFGHRMDHRTKTTRTLISAIILYYDTWPIEKDGFKIQQTETPFMLPISGLSYQGEQVYLTGTMDAILAQGDSLIPVDEKTTSAFGDTWVSKWDMRGQFTCYLWAMRQLGIPSNGLLVRGICLTKEIKFLQFMTYRTDRQIQEWYNSKLYDISQMIFCATEDFWPSDCSEGCNLYYGCSYKKLCTAMDQEHEEYLKQTNYIYCRWNPLTRQREFGEQNE